MARQVRAVMKTNRLFYIPKRRSKPKQQKPPEPEPPPVTRQAPQRPPPPPPQVDHVSRARSQLYLHQMMGRF